MADVLSQIALEVLEGPVPANGQVSFVALEVLESTESPGSVNLSDLSPLPPAGQPFIRWQSDHATPRNISGYLPVFGGDAGSGGAAGSVPAPKAGDATVPKFLRADGIWAAGVSGPQGPPGATGQTGATGSQGPQGATGQTGAQGPAGSQGVAGSNGNTIWNGTSTPASSLGQNGDFYLNTATEMLYGPKANGAWPSTGTSLIGPQGATGQAGQTGATGSQGPQGATGQTGAQGPAGSQGVAGSNGNTIWNGTSTPASSLGQNGDFYLNTATETLYGPKASGAWPSTGTSLIGPQGATGQAGQTGATGSQGPQGATGQTGAQGPAGSQGVAGSNGNTIWNGTSTPASSLGQNGDFYLNTATETLYGPKANGAWPSTGASLIGPQGATGQAGQTGATGAQGPAGPSTLASSTPATSSANSNSPALTFSGNYWNGTVSATDAWTIQEILGTGANPVSTLVASHSGSSGPTLLQLGPNLQINVSPTFTLAGVTKQSLRADAFNNMVMSAFGSGAAYLNYDGGTGGVNFGNGAQGVAASMSAAGVLACPSANFSAPQSLVFGSNWLSYTPAITASGSMTVSSLNVFDAQYLRIGPIVHLKLYVSFTLGGTASNQLMVSLPVPMVGGNALIPSAVLTSTTFWTATFAALVPSPNQITVNLSGGANLPLGSTSMVISGSYRCT